VVVRSTSRSSATARAQAEIPRRSETEGTQNYTVKSGDSLSKIAKRLLGDVNRWPELAQLNNIEAPHVIQPGQVLKVPEAGAATSPTAPQRLSEGQVESRTGMGDSGQSAANFSEHGGLTEKKKTGTLSLLANLKAQKKESTEAVAATEAAAPPLPKLGVGQASPVEVLKNVDSGTVAAQVAIDPTLEGLNKRLNIKKDAKATLNLHVTPGGQIDADKTKVKIEGVNAAGIVSVKGIYIDDKRRIRVKAGGGLIDPLVKDPDITEQVLGKGVKALPKDMKGLTQALENKRKAARQELKNAPKGPPTEKDKIKEAALKKMLNGAVFRADDVRLKGETRLGDSGQVKWGKNTQFDIQGNLNDMRVRGRGDVQSMTLDRGGTKLQLENGSADFEARYKKEGGKMKVDVDLKNVDATIKEFKSEGQDLTVKNAEITGGRIEAHASKGKGGATLDAIKLDANFEGTVIKGDTTTQAKGRLSAQDDGKSVKAAVDLNHLKAKGGAGSDVEASLQGAKVDTSLGKEGDQGVGRLKASADSGRIKAKGTTIDFTQGTLEAKGEEIRALGSAPAKGTLKGSAATLSLEHRGHKIDATDVAFTANAKRVRDGKVVADVELDVGQAKGSLNPSALEKFGGKVGDYTASGKVQLKGATIDPETKKLTGKIDQVDVDVSADIGTIEGKIKVKAKSPRQSVGEDVVAGTEDAQGQVKDAVSATAAKAVKELSEVGGAMAQAKQLKDGKLKVKIPLNEDSIERKAWKLLNVPDGTEITAEIVVENGKPNYAKSKITTNKQIEALGFVDVNLKLNKDGQIEASSLGGYVGKDLYKLPKDLDTLISSVNEADIKKRQSAASKGGVNKTLEKINEGVEVGRVAIEAEGTFKPGPMSIGGDNSIELGPNNHVKISGTSRDLTVKGKAQAGASINVGDTHLELKDGEVDFEVAIKTGISAEGKFEEAPEVHAKIDVKHAEIKEFSTTEGKNAFTLEEAKTDHARIQVDTYLAVNGGKGKTDILVDIPQFEGSIRDTKMAMQNPDGTDASMVLDKAAAKGSLRYDGSQIKATVDVEKIQGRVNDLDLDLSHAQVTDLDGSLSGQGRLSLTSGGGKGTKFTFDGDLTTEARVQDAQMKLGGVAVDMAEGTRAKVNLKRVDTAAGDVQGRVQLDGNLDAATFAREGEAPIEVKKGSTVSLDTEFNGKATKTTGQIHGNFSARDIDLGKVHADRLDGQATLDLGTITTNVKLLPDTDEQEISYRIEGAKLNRLKASARGVGAEP
jgi:LysM repeat protein